jgi:hypothetical protein
MNYPQDLLEFSYFFVHHVLLFTILLTLEKSYKYLMSRTRSRFKMMSLTPITGSPPLPLRNRVQ